jgi:hypothetical protein
MVGKGNNRVVVVLFDQYGGYFCECKCRRCHEIHHLLHMHVYCLLITLTVPSIKNPLLTHRSHHIFALVQIPRQHANRHVGKFLSLSETDVNGRSIQVVENGRILTAKRLLQNKDELTLTRPILVNDTPESIGMNVLSFPNRQVAVRDIADIIGHHQPVHVIDVEHQEELEGWTLADLVEYFEDEERLLSQHQEEAARLTVSKTSRSQRRRKAAEKCIVTTSAQRPRVLNQISLEFSATPLRNKMQSPKFVRDLDWIDHAWPRPKADDIKNQRIPPRVQYYCLTSAAGCYTDFHVDFGGTSVWYHILSGEKIFCLIPPSDENLAAYEDWLCRPSQADIFLPDMIADQDDVIRISLRASQTLVIPTAWIHAVYTPTDSVVIGGNFLHGLDIPLQLRVHCLESRTRVQEKFRFPHFLPINFYAGGMYLERLRRGNVAQREVEGLGELIDSLDAWWKVQQGQSQLQAGPTVAGAGHESASKNNCSSVEGFLAELRSEHQRVVANGISPNPNFAPASSSGKIKLKLKLKVEPPLAPTPSSEKFRIVVSSSALRMSTPVPALRSKRAREDTDCVYDPSTVDDEWMPAGESRKKTSNTSKAKTGPLSTSSQGAKKAQPRAQVRAQKPKANARQRLMKRFR